MRVKVCGICDEQDARAAADAGVDAIGLNFVSGPRKISLARAEAIVKVLPPFVTPVALVRLEEDGVSGEMLQFLRAKWVSWLQVYGRVTPHAVAGLQQDGFRVIAVHRVADASFTEQVRASLDQCLPAAVLLDAACVSAEGGGGRPLDWTVVRQAREAGRLKSWPPVILAGGLTADNLAEAVAAVRPWAVDVSSGVEASPGKKDAAKLRAFVRAARRL